MGRSFRAICWNMRRAGAASGAWRYLLELAPDLALLQDFTSVPDDVRAVYDVIMERPTTKAGAPQRFFTGILVRGTVGAEVCLPAPVDWVARELARFKGNFVARVVTLRGGETLTAVPVYGPAFPIARARLRGIDTNGIQLTQSRDVWCTDLLWAAVKELRLDDDAPVMIAGDLNTSESIDYLWRDGPRGNREFRDRMNAIGFRDCLRSWQGTLIPTYRHTTGRTVHQLDHMYVTSTLLDRLVGCEVGDAARVFAATPTLSDHLPIVADFA